MSLGFEQKLTTTLKEEDGVEKIEKIMKNFAKFIKSKNLKIKETVVLYPKNMRTSFFRGEHLLKICEENKKKIEEIFQSLELNLEEENQVENFLNQFDRTPEAQTKKKLKWPKEMIVSPEQIFGEKMFFYWTFNEKKTSIWAFVIVFSIIGCLLFPIWPLKLKIVAFYSSLYLLIFLIGFILIRLILFMVFRIFGVEFWILPEIFESMVKDDGFMGWLFRFMLLLFFGWISFTVYQDPGSITELKDVGSQSLTDIVAWGRTKIGIDPFEDPYRPKSFAEEMLLKGITEDDMKEAEDEKEEGETEEVKEGEDENENEEEEPKEGEEEGNEKNEDDL